MSRYVRRDRRHKWQRAAGSDEFQIIERCAVCGKWTRSLTPEGTRRAFEKMMRETRNRLIEQFNRPTPLLSAFLRRAS